MNFESKAAEREWRWHFHLQRCRQDRVFAGVQLVIIGLLALKADGAHTPVPPAVRLLLWGSSLISAAVLGLSLAARDRYIALRPHLLVPARIFYSLLCPPLVWHLAAAEHAQGTPDRHSLTGFFLLWVTWTRWGSELLTQVGYLLPFNYEALLAPMSALLDALNNRRLCGLLTHGGQEGAQRFYRATFARLAQRLAMPFEALLSAAPAQSGACPSPAAGGGSDAGGCEQQWDVCTALVGWQRPGGPAAAPEEEVTACRCELVFSLTQAVLSVGLPLLLLGLSEAHQRRQFAEKQLQLQEAEEAAGGGGAAARRRRRSRSAAAQWLVSFDWMRVLALLVLIQVRIFLSLRFGVWQPYGWATLNGGGGGGGGHAEL